MLNRWSFCLTALLLLGAVGAAQPAVAAPGGVTFTDIAAGDDAGITYRRTPSESEAIFDQIKQDPEYDFLDLLNTPLKGRGSPGVALIDFDGDDDLDVYVTNGPGTPNSLYSNQLRETGSVSFVDVAVAAGVAATAQDSTGVCFGDTDNDGDQDLVVLGNAGSNILFENQGDGTFVDISVASGVGAAQDTSISCSLGDVNGDGLLDLVVGNTFDMSSQFAIFAVPFDLNQPNQLLINQGGNTFLDGTADSGIMELDLSDNAPPGAGTITWAIALVDIDQDGDADLLQADDSAGVPPAAQGGGDRGFIQTFLNDGASHFTNVTDAVGLRKRGTWMGLSFGDLDANGTLDVFVTNFGSYFNSAFLGFAFFDGIAQQSQWFLQRPDGTFADPTGPDFDATPFGWGTSISDYDNDGDHDVLFHGGLDTGFAFATAPAALLENDGTGNLTRDAVAFAGSTDHTMRTVHGMAMGDLDGDGFEDVVSVSNQDIPDGALIVFSPPLGDSPFNVDGFAVFSFEPLPVPFFLAQWTGLILRDGTLSVELNSGDNGNRSIQVDVQGSIGRVDGGRVNRDGIGAVVRVEPLGSSAMIAPVVGGSSYGSQDALTMSAGLGHRPLATVEVLWPGGVRNRLYEVRAGERLLFPEIPCSFDDPDAVFTEYLDCVQGALAQLRGAGVLSRPQSQKFLGSAIRAFQQSR